MSDTSNQKVKAPSTEYRGMGTSKKSLFTRNGLFPLQITGYEAKNSDAHGPYLVIGFAVTDDPENKDNGKKTQAVQFLEGEWPARNGRDAEPKMLGMYKLLESAGLSKTDINKKIVGKTVTPKQLGDLLVKLGKCYAFCADKLWAEKGRYNSEPKYFVTQKDFDEAVSFNAHIADLSPEALASRKGTRSTMAPRGPAKVNDEASIEVDDTEEDDLFGDD